MKRAWLSAAAIGGFTSVAAGAVAAHLGILDRTIEMLRTGALFGLVHAAALIAIAVMAELLGPPDLPLSVAGWGFAAGTILFSFSLFALALTGIGWFGLITPFGGMSLLVSWAALGLHALSRRG